MNENIYKALASAYAETSGVAKDREMTAGQRYSYASIDAVIEHVRPVMVKHGLTLHPTGYEYRFDTYQTSREATMNHVICVAYFTCAHTSGETIAVTALGEGADIGDKACNKAMTAAQKYALRQLFCLSTDEDDPDHTSSSTQARQTPMRQQAQRMSESGSYEEATQFTPDLNAWRLPNGDWKIRCPTCRAERFAKVRENRTTGELALQCNYRQPNGGPYCNTMIPLPAGATV